MLNPPAVDGSDQTAEVDLDIASYISEIARARTFGFMQDVETLRALEDALLEFAGSVMVISHDRWFLDRIATHILAFEGESQVVFFDGNYQEYEADKKKRLGEEGAKPKRLRYKPLRT